MVSLPGVPTLCPSARCCPIAPEDRAAVHGGAGEGSGGHGPGAHAMRVSAGAQAGEECRLPP
jgi:hypothetical protein